MANDREKEPILVIAGRQILEREEAAACLGYLWTLKLSLVSALLAVLSTVVGLPIIILYPLPTFYLWIDAALGATSLVAGILIFLSHPHNRRHPCRCNSYSII